MKSLGELTATVVETKAESRVQQVWRDVASQAADAGGMDKETFVELLNGLWSGMSRKPPDATTKQVWYFCLHDLQPLEFANAIRRYLTERSSEFVSVQLIRELSGVQEAKEVAAISAWDEALTAVRLVGSYATPEFSDPYIAQVIQHLCGWPEFCGKSPDELRRFVRGQFLNTYQVVSSGTAKPVKLTNLIEQSNAASGMIGHDERKHLEHHKPQRLMERAV